MSRSMRLAGFLAAVLATGSASAQQMHASPRAMQSQSVEQNRLACPVDQVWLDHSGGYVRVPPGGGCVTKQAYLDAIHDCSRGTHWGNDPFSKGPTSPTCVAGSGVSPLI